MQAAGAAIGGISGLLGQQKEGGTSVGNVMASSPSIAAATAAQTMGINNINNATNQNATSDVQNNAILGGAGGQGGLFGTGGTLQNTEQQLQQEQNQGFNLTPADQTAYGQAAGNIARQYGQQGNSLAQSLASRGMSNSGAAGAQFSGMQGNQMEQLAQAQQNIAQARYNTNIQQMAQNQAAIANLGQQAQGAIGQAYGERLQTGQNQVNAANTVLGGYQQQQNAGLQQQQQTQHQTGLSAAFNGLAGGAMSASGGSGSGQQQPVQSAGGPNTSSSMFA